MMLLFLILSHFFPEPGAIADAAKQPAFVVRIAHDGPLYKKPDPTLKLVGKVKAGEQAECPGRSRDGKFAFIRLSNGRQGWVPINLILMIRKPGLPEPGYKISTGWDFEAGYRVSRLAKVSPSRPRQRIYGFAKSQVQAEPMNAQEPSYSLETAIRGFWDTYNDRRLEIRALHISAAGGSYRLSLGFQEIAWGETFGIFIADIVNPRDLSDPLLDDMTWVRLPVFALNAQAFLDKTTFQLVFTPFPRNQRLPVRGSEFYVTSALPGSPESSEYESFQYAQVGKNAEFGGRVSHLFDSGIDASLLYFNHWNRNVVYSLRGDLLTGPGYLQPEKVRTQTFGATFSKAFDRIVLRGDQLAHTGIPEPNQDLSRPRRVTQWQAIWGMDYGSGRNWTVGAQAHWDKWPDAQRTGISMMTSISLFHDSIKPELFAFHGLNHSELWIQPKLNWNITGAWTAMMLADFISGDSNDVLSGLGLLKDKSRFLGYLTYRW